MSSEGIKLLFAGLDNSGKTSIIKVLLREAAKIAIIEATKGAQRRTYEFLGMKIGEWDLGGQEKYRGKYLKQSNLIFGGTEILIYVIDIKDKQRISKALTYLGEIFDQFSSLDINPSIYFFFHKHDPDLSDVVRQEIKDVMLTVENKISKLTNNRDHVSYRTSIFEKNSIIRAMSEILLIKFPKSDKIKLLIQNFAEKIDAEAVQVMDNNTLMIGAFYKNDAIIPILESTSPYFLEVHDSFEKIQKEPWSVKDHMVVQQKGLYFHFKKFILKRENPAYFIFICKKQKEFDSEPYNTFIRELKELLE